MNCLIYNCGKTADYPFICCSMEHGKKLKELMVIIKSKPEDLTGWGTNILSELTEEEKTYYEQIK